MLPKIVTTFHCLNKLFQRSQKVCKFSAFTIEFQKFFSISITFFFLTLGQNNFDNKIQFILRKGQLNNDIINTCRVFYMHPVPSLYPHPSISFTAVCLIIRVLSRLFLFQDGHETTYVSSGFFSLNNVTLDLPKLSTERT